MSDRLGVLWEGAFFAHHSFANVNRELALLLAERDDVDLGLVPAPVDGVRDERDPRHRALSALLRRRPAHVDCHVRHRWPPDFTVPADGAFVLIQPWDYGWAPVAWVEAIARSVDELWVHSAFSRDAYVRSGVDAEKVAVIPLGVDPAVFNPDAEPWPLATEKSFRFLFVGGAIERKGFDVLLSAYGDDFTADDDVCLVVKDFLYGGHGARLVGELRRRKGAPEVLYEYGNTPHGSLAGLYTACDCYVHPYRGEGFGLTILEAMACGLPVVVTGRGPAVEYCDDDTAYFVPAEEAVWPSWPSALPTVRPPTHFEPNVAALRRLMRQVFEERNQARRKGALAHSHVHERYRWQRTGEVVVERLRSLRRARQATPRAHEPLDPALGERVPLLSQPAGREHEVGRDVDPQFP